MPKELIAIAPRRPAFREYEEQTLKPDEVRIRSIFSAVKHGTELRFYRANTRDHTAPFDAERRIHVEGGGRPSYFPRALGDITVGIVTETGQEVSRFKKGDRVFGYLPIRETHTVSEDHLHLAPEGMSEESIVYSDPASVALALVHDTRICVGDRVAVFGLGAIGQMTVQLARLQGARWIAASDPVNLRRESAAKYSVNLVLNPLRQDVGLIIKEKTDRKGVDVSLETSGSYAALNDALRATTYAGTIASCGYYAGDARGLHLEGEWHRNRLTLLSVREVSEPLRDDPRWDTHRIHAEAFELLKTDRLSAEGLVNPVVPFDRVVEAYQRIDKTPEDSIKLGVEYPE